MISVMNFSRELLKDICTTVESQNENYLTLSSSDRTVDEWKNWLPKFSSLTNTSWNLRKHFYMPSSVYLKVNMYATKINIKNL